MNCSNEEFTVTPYDFGKKFFPRQVNGKLNTIEFLEASRDVVKLLCVDSDKISRKLQKILSMRNLELYRINYNTTVPDKLGKVFSPLSNDISGNIEKIKTCYDKHPEKYVYIEDMILSENKERNNLSVDALLWLKRALHFILLFFQNILNDAKKNECLQEHMAFAYSQALEPYHGWVSRQLFKFFRNLVPNRSTLFSTIIPDMKEEEKEKLVKFLQIYIQSLAENVHHIMSFYKEHDLDSCAKV